MRLIVLCLALLAVGLAAPSHALGRSCGRTEGSHLRAFNITCKRAKQIWGRQPPKGWIAANNDIAGGVAFYCHTIDLDRIHKAIDAKGRVHRRRLHGAQLIFARVPYGE